MRLFTAIDLPEVVVSGLAGFVERFRPEVRIHWSPAENLHITTKFIGEWPKERLEEINETLRRLPARAPIPISVEGLAFFPKPRAPRLFLAGIKAAPSLAALARDTDKALAALGISEERREYSPHLTLARIRTPARLDALKQEIQKPISFGSFAADRFFLYLSHPGRSGSVYTKLSEFQFGNQ